MNEGGRYAMKTKNTWAWEQFDELPSTNEYVKTHAAEKDLIVTAKRQSGGKGTKGRSFSSNDGGVYLTKLTHYTDFKAKDAFLVMASAAVAVCKTLVSYGLEPKIKWPNDVFVADKKICGILIENVFSGAKLTRSIVGIGLNVWNVLPEELNSIATSMKKQGVVADVEEVTCRLIAALDEEISMDEYLSFLGYMGKEAIVVFGDERVPATLLSVDNEGGLWVKTSNGERRFLAAEVSLRFA